MIEMLNKKYIILITAVVSAAVIVLAMVLYFTLRKNLELSIIFINDFESYYEGARANCTLNCQCAFNLTNCVGGFPRIVTMYNRLRNEKNAIFLNAGNNLQESYIFSVRKTAQLLQKLHFDAYTLGNMDLHVGIDSVQEFIQQLKTSKFIACNIETDDEPRLQGLLLKSTVLEVDGYKIGIIGIVSKVRMDKEVLHNKLKYTPTMECINKESKILREKERVFTIILLSQCGFEIDSKIAENTGDRISVIVSSKQNLHSGRPYEGEFAHGPYPTVVLQRNRDRVLIVTTTGLSKYVGYLKVSFGRNGKAVKWSGTPYYLNESVKEDEECWNEVQKFVNQAKSQRNRTVGIVETYLGADGCTTKQCYAGDFVADAMFFCHKDQANISNIGALALYPGSMVLSEINAGNVTIEHLMDAYPTENFIDRGMLKGQYIKNAVIEAGQKYKLGKSNFFQTNGFIEYDMNNIENTSLYYIFAHKIKEKVEHDKFYYVILPSVLSRGKIKHYRSLSKVANGPRLIKCLEKFLKNNPYKHDKQQRIKIL